MKSACVGQFVTVANYSTNKAYVSLVASNNIFSVMSSHSKIHKKKPKPVKCIIKDTSPSKRPTHKFSTHTRASESGQILSIRHIQPTDEELALRGPLSHDSFYAVPCKTKPDDRSMLITGFKPRRLESLQKALLDDEKRERVLKFKYERDTYLDIPSIKSETSSSIQTSEDQSHFSSNETELVSISLSMRKLKYLMGLSIDAEEEEGEGVSSKLLPPFKLPKEELEPGSLAVRKARQYLRLHKIHQFFQFLISHLLAVRTDKPIEFLIDLLERCLTFRKGLSIPPLLYQKNHIERLYDLMDMMKTGFIEVHQYRTGMATLGITNYHKKVPLVPPECLVPKEYFVSEAYNCLVNQLEEMIRTHLEKCEQSIIVTPPPSLATSQFCTSGIPEMMPTPKCDYGQIKF